MICSNYDTIIREERNNRTQSTHLLPGLLEAFLLLFEIFLSDAGGAWGGLLAGTEVNLCWPFSLHQEGVVSLRLLELRD